MLVWVSLIFISNINSAFNFYRASVDESYSPGNKLISGLRDSAVSWAIILPLYWYCEKGGNGCGRVIASSSFSTRRIGASGLRH